jgi:hypothetical protein
MVFIVILLLAFVLQMFFPWWVIVVLAFAVCGIIGKNGKISFWQPFLAIFFLWIAVALYKSIPNGHILAGRIAEMFSLKSAYLVLALTGLLGALVAGISGYCGYQFRLAVLKIKHKN